MEDFWMEHRYNAGSYKLPRHFEHTYQLIFVVAGRILYRVGDKCYEVSKGGVIVLNTLEDHSLEVLEYPYERYIIQINPAFFQSAVKYPEIISIFIKHPADFSHLLTITQPIWNKLYDIILEMEREYKDKRKYWELCVGANLANMFVILCRECADVLSTMKMGSGVEIAYKVLYYLEHHFTEDISVDGVAAELFLNKHYIAHVFKDETGFSIMEYVISLRMNKAKSLLTETDQSVTDIATECGYSDFTYFSRIFKKNTGLSPSNFRKSVS